MGRIPSCKIGTEKWTHIEDLPLTDPTFAQPGKIDLILRADVYGRLLRPFVRKGSMHQLIAQNTVLGWIISEPTGAPPVAVTDPQRAHRGPQLRA